MADTERAFSSNTEEALPVVTRADRKQLLTDLLRDVSRSFYLTLRVLPRRLRAPVGLAYLLARAADTIADTRLLLPGERLRYLLAFRRQVEGPATMQILKEMTLALTDKQTISEERMLLTALPEAFSLLETLPEADRVHVRTVVITLTRGMEIDLTAFPAEDSGQISALKDPAALEHYIYYVAGCVGEFWTTITMIHTMALKRWNAARMAELGVYFGKALQLTNVLRDVPQDLRIGRCYLPETELIRVGITPEALLEPSTRARARPVLVAFIKKALAYYQAAEEYLFAIPRRCLRLRLAVLWPILIGLATLAMLARNDTWLDPAQPSKVTRRWVYRMLALSLPSVCSNKLLHAWIGYLRKQVEEAL